MCSSKKATRKGLYAEAVCSMHNALIRRCRRFIFSVLLLPSKYCCPNCSACTILVERFDLTGWWRANLIFRRYANRFSLRRIAMESQGLRAGTRDPYSSHHGQELPLRPTVLGLSCCCARGPFGRCVWSHSERKRVQQCDAPSRARRRPLGKLRLRSGQLPLHLASAVHLFNSSLVLR